MFRLIIKFDNNDIFKTKLTHSLFFHNITNYLSMNNFIKVNDLKVVDCPDNFVYFKKSWFIYKFFSCTSGLKSFSHVQHKYHTVFNNDYQEDFILPCSSPLIAKLKTNKYIDFFSNTLYASKQKKLLKGKFITNFNKDDQVEVLFKTSRGNEIFINVFKDIDEANNYIAHLEEEIKI